MLQRLLLACVLIVVADDSRAAVSLTLLSDYRYRGASLSDGKPALMGGLVWDATEHWYAGGVLATTRIAGAPGVQAVSYFGYARELRSGRTWEVGAQYVAFSGHREDNYREIYAGFSATNWSARLYFQPKALGEYGPSLYAEWDVARAIGERVQWQAHLGLGHQGSDAARQAGTDRDYGDGRLGISFKTGAYRLQVSRVVTWNRGGYFADALVAGDVADGWVIGVSRQW